MQECDDYEEKIEDSLKQRANSLPLNLVDGEHDEDDDAEDSHAGRDYDEMDEDDHDDDMEDQRKTSMPASLVGLAAGLSSATCLNSPLNLSLGSSSANTHAESIGSTAAAAAAAMTGNLGSGDAASKMPQLILASGQLMQGVQGAQLLIPTSKGKSSTNMIILESPSPNWNRICTCTNSEPFQISHRCTWAQFTYPI